MPHLLQTSPLAYFVILVTAQLFDIMSHFGVFRSLLNFNWPAKLNDMPTELLLCVVDYLPLSSRYMLRQTCRTMRSLISMPCMREIALQSAPDRLIFLSSVAATRPDCILCGRCHALHTMNTKDLPTSFTQDDCYRCEELHPAYEYGLGYRLRFHHVQLALKCSRLRAEQEHLSKLLRPHFHRYTSSEAITYIAEPKVVNGQFFLFSQWSIRPVKASFLRHSKPPVQICPHLRIKYFGISRLNPLDLQVSALLDHGNGRWSSYSCGRCPTDYELAVSPEHISIKIWQCFGSPQSPLDISWRVLLKSDDNTEREGLTVEHVPGSIRNSF